MISGYRWCLFALLLATAEVVCAQGVMLSHFGPVNASMGGASTAAPIEAMSALAWNPATISGLPQSELSFGLGLMLSDPVLESSIPGWSAGGTGAEPGVVPMPNVGWVHRVNDVTTIGLGVTTVGGFKVNYPASLTNPVLAPEIFGGLGSLYTDGQFLQLAPVISFAVTERLAIGVGPTVTMGQIVVDPLVLTAPVGPGIPTYPSGRGTRFGWGGGAQLGAYYITDAAWHLGASIKSPQWMEDFRVHTEDAFGMPQVAKFKFDLPMILSLGVAYAGIEDLVWALDVRYFDYKNTDGFGDSGYGPDGAVRGLGWSNQFAVATGVQYRLNDRLTARTGYTYNSSPFSDSNTFFNVGSPLNYQHQLGVGLSWDLSSCVAFHLGYTHYFEYESTGPIVSPFGPIPGSSVTNRVSAHIASLGVTVRY
jgi:long-chain fatty acid transport protein